MIAIMLVQGVITIGTLVVRRTAGTLAEYSGGMMNRLVENRKVILENEMNQRWSSIHEQEERMNDLFGQCLQQAGMTQEEFFLSDERKGELLDLLVPECLDVLHNQTVTGIFLVLTDRDMETAGEIVGD